MRRYKVAADNLFAFMHTNIFNNDSFRLRGSSATAALCEVRRGVAALLPETVQQPALCSVSGKRWTGSTPRWGGTVLILSARPKDAAWNCGQRTGRLGGLHGGKSCQEHKQK